MSMNKTGGDGKERENLKKRARATSASTSTQRPSEKSFAEEVIGSKMTPREYVHIVAQLLNCYDRVAIDELCQRNFAKSIRHIMMLVRGNGLHPIAAYREIRGDMSLASYIFSTVSGIPDGTTELNFVTWRSVNNDDDSGAKVAVIAEMISTGTKSFETCVYVLDQATEDQIDLTNTALLSLQSLASTSTSDDSANNACQTSSDLTISQPNDLTFLQPYASVLSEFVLPPSPSLSTASSTVSEPDQQMLIMAGLLAGQGKFDIRALPAKINEAYHRVTVDERLTSYFQRRPVKPLQNWKSIEQMKIFFGDESSIYQPVQRKAEPAVFNIRGQFEIYVNEEGKICKTRLIWL